MKTIRLYLVLAILTFAAPSCNNDDETAPPITQENTFSCKINGKLFVPEEHGGFPVRFDGIRVSFIEDNWTIILGNGKKEVYLYLANLTNVGSYKLSNTDGNFDFFGDTDNAVEVDLESVSGASHISTDQSGSLEVLELIERNKLILSFDKIVLQGRFDSEKEIELTDGKLNINVETLNQE